MWAIGDIHGCIDELNQLLDKIPVKDELIFLGDYIDRGPDSKGVIDRLLKEQHRSIFIKGNHEDSLMRAMKAREASGMPYAMRSDDDIVHFMMNGGNRTARSYGQSNNQFAPRHIPKDHWRFFQDLRILYEGHNFIAVHGGLDIEKKLEEQKEQVLMWIRDKWIENESQWKGKFVVYGHTPSHTMGIEGPIIGENSIGLDTGCVFGKSLTAYNTDTKELISVKAKKNYAKRR